MRTFNDIYNSLDEDSRKVVQSEIDRRTTSAIKKYSIEHPAPEARLESINKRIEAIEIAKKEREAQFELKTHALEKCFETGIPFSIISDLLPGFKSAEELDKKIETLSKLSKENDLKRINEELLTGYKPRSGGYEKPDPLDNIRRGLSPGDLEEFDKTINRTRK
jgi:hypothetical protein